MGNCLGRCLAGKNSLRRSTDDQQEELVQEDNPQENFIFKIMKFKRKTRAQFLEKFWERKDLSYSRLNRQNPVETPSIQLQCLDAQTLMLAARETINNKYVNFRPESGMGTSSRASSSLDLEWEHEYGNNNSNSPSWLILPEEIIVNGREEIAGNDSDQQSNASSNNFVNIEKIYPKQDISNKESGKCIVRVSSRTSWSHISTPESLEWDVDEDQQKQLIVEDDSLDHETLALLHEIELLKKKVLNETGEGLVADLPIEEES